LEKEVKIDFRDIRCSYEGFARLVDLWSETKECVFEDIEIDMKRVSWFDANMCAPLGSLLHRMNHNLNTVTLTYFVEQVEKILAKNLFLKNFGREGIQDIHKTTIEYKRFGTKDDRYFASYIESHLIGKGIPKMSPGLLKKFRESIFEIFNNAVIHSQTKHGIFSCGQFYPRKNHLDFTIADLGMGMYQNIKRETNHDLSPSEAIDWAMSENNTTKKGSIPGGLGLKLLRDFIALNEGKIQIASDCGYWEFSNDKIMKKRFSNPFPGTVVNIQINTADNKAYHLSSETRPDDIF